MILLQAQGLRFGYPGVPLFQGLSFVLPSGLSLVRGGDGRGKTTLLRMLAGELPLQAGGLRLQGSALGAGPQALRQLVHLAGLGSEAYAQLDVASLPVALRAQWPAFDAARFDTLVDGLGLRPHLAKQGFMLSTGSWRKLWMAVALAAGAPVTLIDDPFGALDRSSIEFLRAQFLAAAQVADRALVFTAWETPPGLPLAAVVDLGD